MLVEEETEWKLITWCQYVSRKEFQQKPFVTDMYPPLCGKGFHISVLDASCTLTANIQHLRLYYNTLNCWMLF